MEKRIFSVTAITFGLVVFGIVGFGFGRFDMQKEAVQYGHADWTVDKNNTMVFQWRSAR